LRTDVYNMNEPTVTLTSRRNETVKGTVIYLEGYGFFDCRFEECTVVVTSDRFRLEGCAFVNCNWRLEYGICWGDSAFYAAFKSIVDLIDQGFAREELVDVDPPPESSSTTRTGS